MRATTTLAVALTAFAVSGCAAPKVYRWGGYDEALYAHNTNPQDREDFIERLYTVVAEAEASGARVPPGAYAEYGYALLEAGRTQDAVVLFRKEAQFWPESRPLMAKMVATAERLAARTPTSAAGKVPAATDSTPAPAKVAP